MSDTNQMKLNTYLNYKGNCREAFEFYEKHLGGKITMISTFGDMWDKNKIPPDWDDKVLHARVEIGNGILMGADIPTAESMRSAYITLSTPENSEVERIYSLLSDGGQIFIKMQKTFFASRFGMLRDKFGTSWMLLCEE
ncbi:MAG TPA: VOC family protein [Ignavibacteriaceae bacterium]|nr:VOC family protein [Ignavibacteriaceae bacterium]